MPEMILPEGITSGIATAGCDDADARASFILMASLSAVPSMAGVEEVHDVRIGGASSGPGSRVAEAGVELEHHGASAGSS